MQFVHSDAATAEATNTEVRASQGLGDFEAMAPFLAGARARGIADAFELLGMAAILIDASGTVLHVGETATKLLGGDIAIVSRHVIGATKATNRALQHLVASAISGEDEVTAKPVVLPRAGRSPLVVRALPIPGAERDPMQLLKAVLLIAETNAETAAKAAA
jgi:hypothetical protein